MQIARRQQLINRYRDGARAVAVAVGTLSEDDLDRRPTHPGWSARELIHPLREVFRPAYHDLSAREVVHNLGDAEIIESIRLRRMLAENTPVLQHWDETAYTERLHYDRPIAVALRAFEALAMANAELLETLSEQEWRREGNQEKPWPLSVDGWLEERVEHVQQRLVQVLNAVGSGTSPGARVPPK
jgi:hypothetical protein